MFFFTLPADSSSGGPSPEESAAAKFGRLYEEYLPGIYRYVMYRVGDRAAAEDLTADIFNKALSGFSRYDPARAAFSTWIFTIARNTLIDYYRSRGKERKLRRDVENPPPSPDSPEERASRSEETKMLRECISRLKPEEQELISLKFSGGITNREISRITGLSESNVGTILYRAIRKLRDEFSEWRE